MNRGPGTDRGPRTEDQGQTKNEGPRTKDLRSPPKGGHYVLPKPASASSSVAQTSNTASSRLTCRRWRILGVGAINFSRLEVRAIEMCAETRALRPEVSMSVTPATLTITDSVPLSNSSATQSLN